MGSNVNKTLQLRQAVNPFGLTALQLRRTLPPPAVHMAFVARNVLFGQWSISIFAMIGGSVFHDLSTRSGLYSTQGLPELIGGTT